MKNSMNKISVDFLLVISCFSGTNSLGRDRPDGKWLLLSVGHNRLLHYAVLCEVDDKDCVDGPWSSFCNVPKMKPIFVCCSVLFFINAI